LSFAAAPSGKAGMTTPPLPGRIGPGGLAASNDREKRVKAAIAPRYRSFPAKSGHPLSYQGCLNHRILLPLDVPVGGDRRLAFIFDPAETT
jgi:hypothetical protein